MRLRSQWQSWNTPTNGLQIDYTHPLARDLRACWLCTAGKGPKLQDISQYGNHGTLAAGAYWNAGMNGYAIELDGSNDYIGIPDNIIDLTKPFTVFLRASLKANASMNMRLFSLVNATGNLQIVVYQTSYPGRLCNRLAASSILSSASGPLVTFDSQQYSIALTYSPAGVRSFYVNGIYTATASGGVTGNVSYSRIGAGYTNGTYHTFGKMADILVWQRELSQREIVEISTNPYAFIMSGWKYWYCTTAQTYSTLYLWRRVA